VYSDDYFFGGGAGYSDYLSERRLIRAAGRKYATRVARWLRPGKMLDVGAAAGFTLEGFRDAGWNVRGVEPNPRLARHARDQLGIPVTAGSLEEYAPEGSFDLVTMIQVIAHVADPRRALARLAAFTRPGGVVLLETWDRGSLTATLFGSRWHEYSPPSVLHWFTRRGLAALGRECGLQPIHRGTPFKWIDVGHAAGLVAHKLQGSPVGTAVRRLLSLLPRHPAMPYHSEDLFWIAFRRV
jgi:SAM-dependent methyltransferase